MLTNKQIKASVSAFTLLLGTTLGGVAHAADGAIKIGFVGGLSGACASLVEDELNAVKMGVDDINKAGGILGRQVELVVRDSQTKPDEGAKVARDLVVSDDVDVLTGVCSSSVMLSVSAVAKELKTPFYATIGSTQKGNFEAFHHYFWQTQANAMMEAVAAADYVAQKSDWKRIALMGFDYEWGHTSVEAFANRLKELRPDIELTDPLFPKVGEANMAPYITAALSKQPDAVFAAVFGGGLVSLIKQGASFGLFERSNLVTLMTVDTMQSLGSAMPHDHVYGIARAPFFALGDNAEAQTFIEAYRKAYDEYPSDWAINGYDGLMYYAAAAKAAGSVEADPLIGAVTSISYDGLRGKGLKVRAFDGQMNAPTYVGAVTFDPAYDFPTMKDVVKVPGEQLMLSEDAIQKIRDAAK
jgi:branched-chain amino acid transport system substrate-binding protein